MVCLYIVVFRTSTKSVTNLVSLLFLADLKYFPISYTTQAGMLIVKLSFQAPLSRKRLMVTILMSLISDFTKLFDVSFSQFAHNFIKS